MFQKQIGRKTPLGIAFLLDFLIFAALFGVFMLVHYRGNQADGILITGDRIPKPVPSDENEQILLPSTSVVTNQLPPWMTSDSTDTTHPEVPDEPATVLDTSGDFGKQFPERFLQTEDCYLLTEDNLIRDYLSGMNYSFDDADGQGHFIGLYHSHNIFLTVLQVDTTVISASSGNPHKERYFIYDFYVRNIENLYTYATANRDSLENLISLAESDLDFTVGLPIAAVNGDYWGNTGQCLLAERNGILLGSDPSFDYILSDICILYYDGRVETVSPAGFNWSEIKDRSPYQIWNFGPGLLDENGAPIDSFSSSSYDSYVVNNRHPRTVFGYYEPGHYCFVTIDGRSSQSDGLNMKEVGQLMSGLGCRQAYNMDGGDSTYSYFNGQIIRQNEERADSGNPRKIYDIICLGEARPMS